MNKALTLLRSDDFKALLFIIAVSLSLRLMVHFTYYPWWSGDSPSYYGPAYLFAHGPMRYDGGRTPGYPFLMYLAEYFGGGAFDAETLSLRAAKSLTKLQSLLGIFLCCLFYGVMRGLGFNLKASTSVGVLVGLIPHLIILEMAMLPEALSAFTLMASISLLSVSLKRVIEKKPVFWFGIVTGFVCGLSVLVRPNNLGFYVVLLGSLTAGILLLFYYKKERVHWRLLGLCFCVFIGLSLPVSSWMSLNYINTKAITLTPMVPLLRSFAAYNLFDRAPAKDMVLAQIMDKHYKRTNQNGHVKRGYVFQALPEIYLHSDELPIRMDQYPHIVVAVAIYIGNVSQSVLWANPDVWLANAFDNFKDTFTFPVPQSSVVNVKDPRSIEGGTVVKHPLALNWLTYITNILSAPFIVYYLLTFLTLPITVLICFLSRKEEEKIRAAFFAALFMAVLASNLAPCFLAEFYPRFSYPLYPFYLLMGAYVVKYVLLYVGEALVSIQSVVKKSRTSYT